MLKLQLTTIFKTTLKQLYKEILLCKTRFCSVIKMLLCKQKNCEWAEMIFRQILEPYIVVGLEGSWVRIN